MKRLIGLMRLLIKYENSLYSFLKLTYMRECIFFLLLLSFISVHGQKKYRWSGFLKELSSDTSMFRVGENDSIVFGLGKNEPGADRQFETIPSSKIENGKLVIDRKFSIQNPKINEGSFRDLALVNLHFKKNVRISLFSNRVTLVIHGSIFEKGLTINLAEGNGKQIWLTSNEIKGDFTLISGNWDHVVIKENTLNKLKHFNFSVWDCTNGLEITGNKFNTDEPLTVINVDKINKLYITGNQFKSNLCIGGGSVENFFELGENTFEKCLIIQDLMFPPHSQIEWSNIKNKLAVDGDSTDLYQGITLQNLNNKKSFKKLTETYKTLYDNYKSTGDIESSNGCFVAAKDLEGARMEALYKVEGGFKNYFNWKLNRLMKFYTNHATEPALALVISIYILLGFAVFYFFFPSEWDLESKGKLIQHYKDFMQKNDKGYAKPFLKLTWGFMVSFINALTLSLNSFVTLGFGNIPTKGLARYVCIIQGFTGWFLLSIFTVALFNQVLF